MPKFENETYTFRHRGFADIENSATVMIFGNDPDPVDSKGAPLSKLWDHDVTTTTKVVDHQG